MYPADSALTDTSLATTMARAEGTTILAFSVKKKRPARVFFVALIVIVLYFVLFPYPLGREIVAKPVWSVTLPDPSAPNPPSTSAQAPDGAKTTAAPFQLGDLFGYVGGRRGYPACGEGALPGGAFRGGIRELHPAGNELDSPEYAGRARLPLFRLWLSPSEQGRQKDIHPQSRSERHHRARPGR